jgi:glycosyltransferase involved in cell wall biosynthesis
MGMPVVSTSVGCEGLLAVDGQNILIRDSPSDFASAVVQVLSDRELAARLGRNARATVEREYSWEQIGQSMVPLYRALSDSP